MKEKYNYTKPQVLQTFTQHSYLQNHSSLGGKQSYITVYHMVYNKNKIKRVHGTNIQKHHSSKQAYDSGIEV